MIMIQKFSPFRKLQHINLKGKLLWIHMKPIPYWKFKDFKLLVATFGSNFCSTWTKLWRKTQISSFF
jgi:hypothetical protein